VELLAQLGADPTIMTRVRFFTIFRVKFAHYLPWHACVSSQEGKTALMAIVDWTGLGGNYPGMLQLLAAMKKGLNVQCKVLPLLWCTYYTACSTLIEVVVFVMHRKMDALR
jgi:hypothetical protein